MSSKEGWKGAMSEGREQRGGRREGIKMTGSEGYIEGKKITIHSLENM